MVGGRQQRSAPYRLRRRPLLGVQIKLRIRNLMPIDTSPGSHPQRQFPRRDCDPVRQALGVGHPPLLDVEKPQPLGLAPSVPHRTLRHPGARRDSTDV